MRENWTVEGAAAQMNDKGSPPVIPDVGTGVSKPVYVLKR
jgi:hypothetical protein